MPPTLAVPVISSLLNVTSRQWAPAVPAPPTFSTGTPVAQIDSPPTATQPRLPPWPMYVTDGVPAFTTSESDLQSVPTPTTCSISCVMTPSSNPCVDISS